MRLTEADATSGEQPLCCSFSTSFEQRGYFMPLELIFSQRAKTCFIFNAGALVADSGRRILCRWPADSGTTDGNGIAVLLIQQALATTVMLARFFATRLSSGVGMLSADCAKIEYVLSAGRPFDHSRCCWCALLPWI